jgi:Ser/Thr protein kinase RdoA (MazF antagonist)
MSDILTPPADVLARWPPFEGARVRPFGTGLINRTFLVETPHGKWVLQQLHPIFGGVVNEDIDAVTAHLAARGLVTTRPVRTGDGALWVDDAEGRPWRALTFVPGTSSDTVTSPAHAAEAGRLVARFHAGVSDLEHTYRHVRPSVHDTARHLATLETALSEHRDHRLYGTVAPVAQALLMAARDLPDFGAMPLRHVHGDLKISNLLFDEAGHGLCLVDLDTLGRMPWAHEMGDALRSWCNPAGEDVTGARVDAALFEGAVRGYASGADHVTLEERAWLVSGLSAISLELSARFLADALNERYFGWNAAKYPTRGDHNLVRGLGQWSLHRSVEASRGELERLVREAFKKA